MGAMSMAMAHLKVHAKVATARGTTGNVAYE